jgi:hypothetical protein
MKALTLNAENEELLIKILKEKLYKSTKRIELDKTPSGMTVIFSRVAKFNPLNIILNKFVNSEVPLLELFMREIPEKLSKYGTGNKSFAPLYLLQISLLSRSTGDNLVHFLDETIRGIKQPTKKRDDYEVVKEAMDKLSGANNAEKSMRIVQLTDRLLGDDSMNFMEFFAGQ